MKRKRKTHPSRSPKTTTKELLSLGLLKRALHASSNGIVITDPNLPDNPIVFVNEGYQKMTGYSASEVLGKNPRLIQGPGTDSEARETFKRAIEEGKPCSITILNYRKDGTPFWNEINVSPVFDGSGKLVNFIAVKTDITERRQQEEKFHTVFEAAPNGMVIVDMEGKMVMINSQMEKLFGYPREELIGQAVEMLVPERYRARHPSHRKDFMANPGMKPLGSRPDLTGLRKDGEEIAIELGLGAFETSAGRMALATVMDITERKKSELMEKEIISIVSHELRTPLTSIRGSLGLMAGGKAGEISSQVKVLLDIAAKNCERLVRMINNILDIDKIESGSMAVRLETLEIGPLVEEVSESNQGYGEEYGVRLALTKNLPAARIRVDRDLFIRVLTNLASNAIKFSNRGDTVMISVARNGTFLRVTVRDTGPGIPEAFRPHVFKKFSQAAAAGPRKGGTGLGLSISKSIIEQLGGTIDFETIPGSGTCFFVDIPEWTGTS